MRARWGRQKGPRVIEQMRPQKLKGQSGEIMQGYIHWEVDQVYHASTAVLSGTA
jgi:hypothetical protein